MKKELRLQAFLFCAVILMSVLLSQRLYLRIDTTQAQTYSLSAYTKSILDGLDGTVTITWFRSHNIDGYIPALQYLEDILREYQLYANERLIVVYKDSAELSPQQLQQIGITARQIEKKSAETRILQNLYSGLLCEYRGKTRVIPFLSDIYTLESDIARFIIEMNQDAQNRQEERSLYVVLPPNTTEAQYKYVLPWLEYAGFLPIVLTPPFPELRPDIPLLIIGSEYFDTDMLIAVDVFIQRQGSAAFFVSANTVDTRGTWQAVPKKEDGLLDLLTRLGFAIQHNLVMDPLNFHITLPSADGSRYETLNYPFWPQVFRQEEQRIPPLLPAGKMVQFFWPSELICTAARGKTPLTVLSSSPHSVLQAPPYNTDPHGKQLATTGASDHAAIPLAAVSDTGKKETHTQRLAVVADEYCVSTAVEYTNSDANMDFMVNIVHWIARQEALLELKNKQPAILPFRYFESDGAFNRIITFSRIFNLVILPLLIIMGGVVVYAAQRRSL